MSAALALIMARGMERLDDRLPASFSDVIDKILICAEPAASRRGSRIRVNSLGSDRERLGQGPGKDRDDVGNDWATPTTTWARAGQRLRRPGNGHDGRGHGHVSSSGSPTSLGPEQ
jgi:hypothetical protein